MIATCLQARKQAWEAGAQSSTKGLWLLKAHSATGHSSQPAIAQAILSVLSARGTPHGKGPTSARRRGCGA